MALSQTVKDSLKEAEPHIRNALAYSARQERPQTTLHIAQILNSLSLVIDADISNDFLERLINKYRINEDLE